MIINSTWQQLKQSWHRQYKAAEVLGENFVEPSALLKIYAIECALKAILVKEARLRGVTELNDFQDHDLRSFIRRLNVPAVQAAAIKRCRPRTGQGAPIEVPHLHQAWRYGQLLHESDERDLIEGLEGLHTWCVLRLGGSA